MSRSKQKDPVVSLNASIYTTDSEKLTVIVSIQKRWGDPFTNYIPKSLWYSGPPLRGDLQDDGPSSRPDQSGLYWPIDVLKRLEELSTLGITRDRPEWVREVLDRVVSSRATEDDRVLLLHANDVLKAHEEITSRLPPYAYGLIDPDLVQHDGQSPYNPDRYANAEDTPYHRQLQGSPDFTGLPRAHNSFSEHNSEGSRPDAVAQLGNMLPPTIVSGNSSDLRERRHITAVEVVGFDPNHGWYHGPYSAKEMLVAPGVSPICGYVTNQTTGEQCGVTVSSKRKGLAATLRDHLRDIHGVIIMKAEGMEERARQSQTRVRFLDLYYRPGGQLDHTTFREGLQTEKRKEVQRAYLEDVPANIRHIPTLLPPPTPVAIPTALAAPVETARSVNAATPAVPTYPELVDRDTIDKVSTPAREASSELRAREPTTSDIRTNPMNRKRRSSSPIEHELDSIHRAMEKKRTELADMKLQRKMLKLQQELVDMQDIQVHVGRVTNTASNSAR